MTPAINSVAAVAALILATASAVPASAATLDQGGAASVEIVQYREYQQTPRRTIRQSELPNGSHAYATEPRSARSHDTENHNTVYGWPCAYRDESSAYSAFPSWELCN